MDFNPEKLVNNKYYEVTWTYEKTGQFNVTSKELGQIVKRMLSDFRTDVYEIKDISDTKDKCMFKTIIIQK